MHRLAYMKNMNKFCSEFCYITLNCDHVREADFTYKIHKLREKRHS